MTPRCHITAIILGLPLAIMAFDSALNGNQESTMICAQFVILLAAIVLQRKYPERKQLIM